MQIILTHFGSPLPIYLEDTFKQIRYFSNLPVYFLSDQEIPEFAAEYGVEWFNCHNMDKDYQALSKMGHPNNDFWCLTAKRLWYLADFTEQFNLTDSIHFENDVLIYVDPLNIKQSLKSTYENIGITRGTALDCMTGFMYLAKPNSLKLFTQFAEELLNDSKRLGEQGYEMLHEMALLGSYLKQNKPELCDLLPSLPFGPLSKNFDKVYWLFDPASWGQYKLGTHSNPTPGWMEHKHFIGHELIKKTVAIEWHTIDGLKKPFVINTSNAGIYPLANLHVHSKLLYQGLSK